MLHIGFILPPSTNAKPFRQVPLTSLYLLTILEEKFGNKIDASVIDLRGVKEEDIAFYVPEKDLYLYTVMSPEWEDIKLVHRTIRTAYPMSKHVAGGVHVYLFQKECMGIFDSISIGAGEITAVELVNDLLEGNELKKLYVYEKIGEIDINNYPIPSRKFLPKTAIVQTGLLVGKNYDLLTSDVLFSRWCPFHCAFCVNITFGKTKFRSPINIETEIEYLKKEYGIRAMVIKDDNGIPIQKDIATPFLEAIARTNVKWRGQSRANGISDDTVKLAADSGCTDIAIGIESASPQVLKAINKNIDLNIAKGYIESLKKYGIGVRLLLIMGLPGEDENIYSQMLNFVNETNPTSVVLSLFSPYPGSPIMQNPDKYGIEILPHEYKQLRNYFGRLNKDETPEMFFKYKEVTPWGKPLSNETILNYYSDLQSIFRERGLNF